MSFPAGFGWGVATAAYQNEGAVAEDGKSPSIWDTFAHTPGKISDGQDADTTCDHYHRYREDVDLLTELGVGFYRFSLAWSRVQPDGRGALNPAGVDFYSRLIEALLERGIEPWPTLYHWDLPQSLQDAGGWSARETAFRFAEYASKLYERFRDRVKFWTTLNEPWASAFIGHAEGRHAPGIQDPLAALRSAHHLQLAHGLAVAAMRSQGHERSHFGITLILSDVNPATDEQADVESARAVDLLFNRMWLDPILRGRYPDDLLDHISGTTDGSYMEPGDDGIIAAPLDFLGVNYYSGRRVRRGAPASGPSPWVACTDARMVSRGLPVTDMGWEVDPEGLYDLLVRLKREYPPMPLYVTENGAAFDDAIASDGTVPDPGRVAYLDSHLRAAHRAISDGVDLRGYFVWTLMDNFEWSFGFTRKFGLYHVDFASQKRTAKDSARWFAGVTARNGLLA